jgi:hypothetical protein
MEKSMVTWIIVGVVVAAGAGFGAGWGLRGSDTSKVIEHQTQAGAFAVAIRPRSSSTKPN